MRLVDIFCLFRVQVTKDSGEGDVFCLFPAGSKDRKPACRSPKEQYKDQISEGRGRGARNPGKGGRDILPIYRIPLLSQKGTPELPPATSVSDFF